MALNHKEYRRKQFQRKNKKGRKIGGGSGQRQTVRKNYGYWDNNTQECNIATVLGWNHFDDTEDVVEYKIPASVLESKGNTLEQLMNEDMVDAIIKENNLEIEPAGEKNMSYLRPCIHLTNQNYWGGNPDRRYDQVYHRYFRFTGDGKEVYTLGGGYHRNFDETCGIFQQKPKYLKEKTIFLTIVVSVVWDTVNANVPLFDCDVRHEQMLCTQYHKRRRKLRRSIFSEKTSNCINIPSVAVSHPVRNSKSCPAWPYY